MSFENDLRQRDSKRKIFLDDNAKPRPEDKNHDFALLPKRQPLELPARQSCEGASSQQRWAEEVRELRGQLAEEREKYDQLFEEYEELIEKNNLIEKEYINLKYDHNKELKQLRKHFKEAVDQQIAATVEEFTARLAEEELWDTIKNKIHRFLNSLTRITEVFLLKSKKHPNKDQKPLVSEPPRPTSLDENTERAKPERSSIREIAAEERVVTSPGKEREVQVVGSHLSSREVVLEDEYYGELQDYEQLEEKIAQRKNYELLKNCNRNSTDTRRKKIFNKAAHFQ